MTAQQPPTAGAARPVRFDDPAKNAAYWALVQQHADAAPPLTDEQRAALRLAIHGIPRTRTEAAA